MDCTKHFHINQLTKHTTRGELNLTKMNSLVTIPLHEHPDVLAAVFWKCRQGSKVTEHTAGAAQLTPAFYSYFSVTPPPHSSWRVPMETSQVLFLKEF